VGFLGFRQKVFEGSVHFVGLLDNGSLGLEGLEYLLNLHALLVDALINVLLGRDLVEIGVIQRFVLAWARAFGDDALVTHCQVEGATHIVVGHNLVDVKVSRSVKAGGPNHPERFDLAVVAVLLGAKYLWLAKGVAGLGGCFK